MIICAGAALCNYGVTIAPHLQTDLLIYFLRAFTQMCWFGFERIGILTDFNPNQFFKNFKEKKIELSLRNNEALI